MRKFNQFIPFFAERDNVGNLISERSNQSKELIEEFERETPQAMSKDKRSISEANLKSNIFE